MICSVEGRARNLFSGFNMADFSPKAKDAKRAIGTCKSQIRNPKNKFK